MGLAHGAVRVIGGPLQTSHLMPLCLWDLPSFNLHPHHCENFSNDKALILEDKKEFSTEVGKIEKCCIVGLIYGNLFLLRKKVLLKGGK